MTTITYPLKVSEFITSLGRCDERLADSNEFIDTMEAAEFLPPEPPVPIHTAKTTTTAEVETNGTAWIDETLVRLQKVAQLSDNWDDRGSPGTDPAIVDAAVSLLLRLQKTAQSDVPVPSVCPIAGGSFQFEWASDQRHLEMEFLDECRIVFLTEEIRPQPMTMDSGEFPLSRIDDVRQLLDWFASA